MTLTMEDRTVIDDTRFIINRGYLKQWNLFINQVKWEDQGVYRCTVNTVPPKYKQVNLHVKGMYQTILLDDNHCFHFPP